MQHERILGIDLGTTNSAFAVLEAGEPEIVENSRGDTTTPSVVAMRDGEPLVGEVAVNQAVQNPHNTVSSIKRHMGDDFTVDMEDERYTPEEVSAMILRKIKQDASERLDEDISRAVITVPAYYTDSQRQATKDAGEIAGLEVEKILNEPTAAAMAYGFEKGETNKTILVFDLGGGTFDISILEIKDELFEVVATNGDDHLGGDDWDNAIVDWLAEGFKEEHGVDITDDVENLKRLSEKAKEAKHHLTEAKEAQINIPYIAESEGITTTLSRSKFEGLTEDLVERTVEPTNTAMEDAGLEPDDIDEILLVGGATRMPMIQEKVQEMFGREPQKTINPDEAVALGAAVEAGTISGEVDDLVLVDVTPLSLGVEVKGGVFERLIKRNTKLPTEASKVFTTGKDGQTKVRVRVYQGEREMARDNELLAEFSLGNITPAPAGLPKIEVKFSIGEDGIVNVEAKDKASGRHESLSIEGGVGMDPTEVERLRQEAKEHFEKDKQRRERAELRNDADNVIQRADRLLMEDRERISDALTTELTDEIQILRELTQEQVPDEGVLKEQKEKVESLLQRAGKEVYEEVHEEVAAKQNAANPVDNAPELGKPATTEDEHEEEESQPPDSPETDGDQKEENDVIEAGPIKGVQPADSEGGENFFSGMHGETDGGRSTATVAEKAANQSDEKDEQDETQSIEREGSGGEEVDVIHTDVETDGESEDPLEPKMKQPDEQAESADEEPADDTKTKEGEREAGADEEDGWFEDERG